MTDTLFSLAPYTSTNVPTAKLAQLKNGPIWTKRKSLLIKLYLDLFVKVTFRGTYIDAFAGPQEQESDAPENWSAKRLWETNPGPKRKRIDRFELIEKNPASFKKLQAMIGRTAKDRRFVKVHKGDCNKILPELFLARKPKGPTFCLLDQRAVECHWETVKTIASYNINGHKPEIFYFLMASWKDRSLGTRLKTSPDQIKKWWGRDDIKTPKDLSIEKLGELFAERFKSELGYKSCNPFPIWDNVCPDLKGKRKFFMIHASDHDAAPGFMVAAYNKLGSGYDPARKEKQDVFEWTSEEIESLSKVNPALSEEGESLLTSI